jgi:phosphohistidine phosphatase
MKTLIIVRHAKAEHGAGRDFDRSLSARGREDAPLIARHLASAGLQPDHMCSSSAARALETAELLAGTLAYPPEAIAQQERIYHADVSDMLSIIRSFDESHRIAVLVGHNPTMHGLAESLTRERLDEMPTCGAAWVDLDVRFWHDIGRGSGTLRRMLTPKHLRKEN